MKKVLHASEKEVYLYFAEDATYASGNQAIFKASDFYNATTALDGNTILRFHPQDKARNNVGSADYTFDTVTLTHTANAQIEVMTAIGQAMSNPHGGFVVIQDDLGTAFSSDGSSLGAAFSDINYAPIASTGTAVEVTACTIATI
jgi:hypothetical protein|tara:strand:+ start:107 stop:541 length:435 start_codon:yes stop_codon:yes gene_type:complete